MQSLTRRKWLTSSTATLTLASLSNLYMPQAQARPRCKGRGIGLGPLQAKLPLNSDELPESLRDTAFLALPQGFEYSVISVANTPLSNGDPVPTGHDGMAAFRGPRGTTLLVRNHELGTSGTPVVVARATYDEAVRGGTTTLVVDARGRLIEHYASLGGTERNCAGGPTPWGTWITCEETFSTRGGIRHGYCFEVPSSGFSDAQPLKGLGRFNHEAVAIDPRSGIVYLTEDRGDSLLYRFIPASYGDLRSPGRLEALKLVDWPEGVDTSRNFLDYLYAPLAVAWVPIEDFDPDSDTTRAEGQSRGAARFARGEGAWYGEGLIYFCCTSGGDLGRGQVFSYDPRRNKLTLFVESTDAEVLDAPDNITVGPDGRLYLTEDGGGSDNIVGVERSGELFTAVENVFNTSEFCGACFSHDGQTMFVNTQSPGLTYVIRGPWRRR